MPAGVVACSVLLACLLQIRGQDLHIPAAAGPQLNDCHVWLQTKEGKGFCRVAIDIPFCVVWRAATLKETLMPYGLLPLRVLFLQLFYFGSSSAAAEWSFGNV